MANMPWKDAIVEVLRHSGEAMHYTDIAAEIEKRGLRHSLGATPAKTVSANITTSIAADGAQSPFVRTNRGVYMLRERGAADTSAAGSQSAVPAEAEAEPPRIIRAMGMYWQRSRVIWQRNPRLLGQAQEGASVVNFAGQVGVYLLYDRSRVIYVGRSVDRPLGTRLFEHTKDRLNGRWDRFSWFGLRGVDEVGNLTDAQPGSDQSTLIALMEALLIETLEPPQNRKRGDDLSDIDFMQADDPKRNEERERAMQLLLSKS